MNVFRPILAVRVVMTLALASIAACGVIGESLDAGGVPAGLPTISDGSVPADFARFVAGLRPSAIRAGVPGSVFDRAFAGVGPDTDVLTRARYQPEFRRPIWDYFDDATTDSRVADGRVFLAREGALLDRIEATYGVPREVVVAIWGMESSYGASLGDLTRVKNVVRSLATLAWKDGRRADYARTQLFAALKVLAHGDIDRFHMIGSWAGAMGHTQFIPTTYLAYAVDFDGDGRRDIWNSQADALASAANYLKRSGWRSGAAWGYEVRLPASFSAVAGTRAPLAAFAAGGVTRADGGLLPSSQAIGRLYTPAGREGPVFLTLANFDVLKRYNAADAYALSVGFLSDRLAGGGPLVAAWPRGYTPLDEAGRIELQTRLRSLGFSILKIDGRIGPESITAIRDYQSREGLVVDGNASLELLQRLRTGG